MFLEPVDTVCEEIEIKKSRFISWAKKVLSRQDAMDFVLELKAQYPDARHVCWGYLIGDPNNSTNSGCNDDGEPSGTAGKPILSQINYSNIGNVVVVTVRYFGGIRLGAGGLVRAYRESAQKALQALKTQEYTPLIEVTLLCSFNEENHLRRLVESLYGQIIDAQYKTEVALTVKIPEKTKIKLSESLAGFSVEVIYKDLKTS